MKLYDSLIRIYFVKYRGKNLGGGGNYFSRIYGGNFSLGG